jgi:hypothetical protein
MSASKSTQTTGGVDNNPGSEATKMPILENEPDQSTWTPFRVLMLVVLSGLCYGAKQPSSGSGSDLHGSAAKS